MKRVACTICGAIFYAESAQRKYCVQCAKFMNRKRVRANYYKNKDVKPLHDESDNGEREWMPLTEKFEKRRGGPSIEEVANAAAKAGMTYGKYVAMYGSRWR